jgi:hypothetical protein
VVVDYVPRDPGLTGLASRAALGERARLGEPAAPPAAASAQDQAFDLVPLGCDGRGGWLVAGTQSRDRPRQLHLRFGGEG